MRKVSIYSLIDPRDNLIKYIGKTVQKNPSSRFNQHLFQWKRDKGRHNKLNSWIKSLDNQGLKPIFTIEDSCVEGDWKAYERGYITLLKACGANLKNQTNGGDEPSPNCNSPEAKAKRLESLKTSEAWRQGRKSQAEKLKKWHLSVGHDGIYVSNAMKKKVERMLEEARLIVAAKKK